MLAASGLQCGPRHLERVPQHAKHLCDVFLRPRGLHLEARVDLAEEDRQTQVLEALDDLPANERKAIVQVILQGTSLREVARESGVSAMTIQRRVKRGLGSLSIALRGLSYPTERPDRSDAEGCQSQH